MAIAINHFPITAVSQRKMAPMYRRRRLFVSLAIAALAVTVSFNMFDSAASADQTSASKMATPKFVIAEAGDTLWAIAQRIAPNANLTEVVDQLVLMNGDAIAPGQLVRIP